MITTTTETVTDAQITELRERVAADPTWGHSRSTRERLIKACDRALESRAKYRGSLAAIVAILNLEAL